MGNEKERFTRSNCDEMSLHHGTKTKVRVGPESCEEFLVQAGVRQGSVLSPLLFAIAVDVITEKAREG